MDMSKNVVAPLCVSPLSQKSISFHLGGYIILDTQTDVWGPTRKRVALENGKTILVSVREQIEEEN